MQSKEDVTTHLMERLDGRVARRAESRMARRWWTQQAVEAISRLEAGALLDEVVHLLDAVGVRPRGQALQGAGIQRERGEFFQAVMR